MLDRRRKGLIVIALLVAALAARHPTADFRLVTHDIGDPQPHRVQAAVDLGLVGVSFLYTWSQRLG
ncbi:putative YccA/Bax inhibitor family protein [Sphingomonas jinjuensis]|uniref:Putative YccA/Bax inhibitor family protein n=1 Tax=Sphingomonas jinjuensis TaxID=535907 RepID=A0A840FGK8_9SPHN|nr:hypothetical protein [Sphingomonas jinjuensis]MBB4154854.1 putative YccA/Bax inhibitor family protein [Sphingomonas jinjuensis]